MCKYKLNFKLIIATIHMRAHTYICMYALNLREQNGRLLDYLQIKCL